MRILLAEDSEEEIQKALAAIHVQFPGTRMLGQKKSPAFADWTERYVFCHSPGKADDDDSRCDIYVHEDMQTPYVQRPGEHKIDLVVTDLMLPMQPGDTPLPHGLSIMIRALRAGLPVALATSENHHQCSFVPEVVSLLPAEQQARFFLSTTKNWGEVITAAFEYIKENKKKLDSASE